MKYRYVVALLIMLIPTPSADYWSSQVTTNSTSWNIYRQSTTLSFDLSGTVEGTASPLEYHGRRMRPCSTRFEEISTNDVRYRGRTSAFEGRYRSDEEIGLKSDTRNEVNISVHKDMGSDIYRITYQEQWPASLIVKKSLDYSGIQINDRNFEGNNRDYVGDSTLYSTRLKKDFRSRMKLYDLNATLLATNDRIISARLGANKYLDYSLDMESTGISDLIYGQSSLEYDLHARDYISAGEGSERYYGNYSISRRVNMASRDHALEDTQWLSCCFDGYVDELERYSGPEGIFGGRPRDLSDEYRSWFNKGLALLKSGSYDEAIAAYEKAIELDRSNATAWNQRGIALSMLGRYGESVASFDEAVSLNPRYSNAWYNKAKSLTTLGKYEEALEAIDRAIEIDPGQQIFRTVRDSIQRSLNGRV